MPLGNNKPVVNKIFSDHIPGLTGIAAPSTDTEPLPLPERMKHQTLVSADDVVISADNIAGLRREILGEKVAELALSYKADAGTVLFGMIGKARRRGQSAYFGFQQVT